MNSFYEIGQLKIFIKNDMDSFYEIGQLKILPVFLYIYLFLKFEESKSNYVYSSKLRFCCNGFPKIINGGIPLPTILQYLILYSGDPKIMQ